MDEIDYVAGSAFFLNKSGNPASLDSALDRVHSLIEEWGYERKSPEFIYYLDRIAEDMIISVGDSAGPDPMWRLPYTLEYSLSTSRDIPDEDYQFYMFYILCKLHYNLDDYKGMRKAIERYGSDFRDQPYYGKIESLSLIRSDNKQDMSEALDNVVEYSEKYPKYPELRKISAEIIA